MARLGKFFYINGTDNLSNAHFLRVRADGGITESLGCIDTAGTLLESASYFMRPSGYKEDTVYSLIPNNSNGSLNFVRGSDAWRTEIGGLVQRTPYNLLQQSETFENSAWNKIGSSTISNLTTAPNGTLTADKLVENTSTGFHRAVQAISGSIGSTYTFSVYLKASERNWALVWFDGEPAGTYVNLTTGALGTVSAGVTASTASVGDGWWRCLITKTIVASANVSVYTATGNNGASYTGDGTSGIFVWGAQLVEGADQLPYFPTTDRLNVPRLSYMYGSCPALLLEPQRTNSIRNSSMVGAVAGSPGTMPSNWASAVLSGLTQTIVGTGIEKGLPYIDLRFNGTATGTTIRIATDGTTAISASNGQTWTHSFYAKLIEAPAAPNNYNLYTQQLAAGGTNLGQFQTAFVPTLTLQRYTQTFTTDQATIANIRPYFWAELTNGATYDFTIRIAQPQMESGAYATTSIFTTGSATATRIADSFSRNNIYTNGLITSSGGTWFVELRNNIAYTRDGAGNAIGVGDSTALTTNSFVIRNNSATASRMGIVKRVGGVLTVLYATTTDTVKIAIKWNGSTADVFVNGTKQVSSTAFTATNMEFLQGDGAQQPAFIQSMALFNYPLSDSDCQLLTT